MTTDLMAAADATAAPDEFAARVLAAGLGGLETLAVHLGATLGWYRALADHGPLTSPELAALTDSHERYAREWLEHQAASGYLTVEDAAAPATARRFRLHAGAAAVLADPDSLVHTAPLARMIAASGKAVDDIARAYREGGGVSWEQLGAHARESQSAFNRPLFLHRLAQELIPAVPDLHARLSQGARVADVGTGEGWSAIGLARAYPQVEVAGYDIDGPSIAAARRHAAAHGVADRVSFEHVDAATVPGGGAFDVVTAFECVHDMPDPVAVLAAMRRMVTDDGYVLVADERTAEVFRPAADAVERLLYGFSLTVCLPDGLSTAGSVGTGTVMRLDTLRAYARSAGFADVEVLPIEHDLLRFHRLTV